MTQGIVLIVVDSLRSDSIRPDTTPFLYGLRHEGVWFDRAYAAECWTLPSHLSMFTGLMPREHGAHFGTMAYLRREPTIAELLQEKGYATEAVTRNFVFDGNIPGLLRGFQRVFRPLASHSSAAAYFLALAKPRIRRHLRETGFFNAGHRESLDFVNAFARSLLPADEEALDTLLKRAVDFRSRGQRFFIFANLYDVHAPYPPQMNSILRPWSSWSGLIENILLPPALAKLGAHRYLCPGFTMPQLLQDQLRERYSAAVAMMDRKLETFFRELENQRLLDDSLVILTSDHGEAFGEHGLYLHDASVFETHLHVPLWIHTPRGDRGVVTDVVSTRDLFALLGDTDAHENTILDVSYREQRPFVEADHFHYPHLRDADPQYRVDQRAVITAANKFVVRGRSASVYDLQNDWSEEHPEEVPFPAFRQIVLNTGIGATAANALMIPQ